MSNKHLPPGTALVLSYSSISTDPRVRRQIDWLAEEGWVVDTIGLGEGPSQSVRHHFELHPAKAWATSKLGVAMSHLTLPNAAIFHLQVLSRIPGAAKRRVAEGRYDLMLFNELEFSPWARIIQGSLGLRAPKMHLDLHEYHNTHQRRDTLGGRITSRHYRWLRSSIGDTAFATRTVVNKPIGDLYLGEYNIAPMTEVRNIPPFVSQDPSPVSDNEIRLLFHGLASMQRGFEQILEALRILPQRFSMTFMIMPNPAMHQWLQGQISAHPAKDRIKIVAPAPMSEIAEWINEFDLEVIFYQPTSHNLEYALPNKFFESIQGRLGVVVAEGKTMAPLVREWGNGVVVDGYGGDDLAAALGSITAHEVTQFKAASSLAAEHLNATTEGKRFVEATLSL